MTNQLAFITIKFPLLPRIALKAGARALGCAFDHGLISNDRAMRYGEWILAKYADAAKAKVKVM